MVVFLGVKKVAFQRYNKFWILGILGLCIEKFLVQNKNYYAGFFKKVL